MEIGESTVRVPGEARVEEEDADLAWRRSLVCKEEKADHMSWWKAWPTLHWRSSLLVLIFLLVFKADTIVSSPAFTLGIVRKREVPV